MLIKYVLENENSVQNVDICYIYQNYLFFVCLFISDFNTFVTLSSDYINISYFIELLHHMFYSNITVIR